MEMLPRCHKRLMGDLLVAVPAEQDCGIEIFQMGQQKLRMQTEIPTEFSGRAVTDTVRTFFLVVLSVLGPIAFAISVWDGFQSTLGQWFTRYISVYLWLPVSDLFSCMLAKIQVLMLQNDIAELQGNPDYSLDNSNCVGTDIHIYTGKS